MLLLSFYLIKFFFVMKITFIFHMFRDVPGCSEMFHVPGFIDTRIQNGMIVQESLKSSLPSRVTLSRSPKNCPGE